MKNDPQDLGFASYSSALRTQGVALIVRNIFQAYEQSGPDAEELLAQVLSPKNTLFNYQWPH